MRAQQRQKMAISSQLAVAAMCNRTWRYTVLEAQINALEVCGQVTFTGMQYRSDIG